MGQKVQPTSVRLNVNRTFEACWYNDNFFKTFQNELLVRKAIFSLFEKLKLKWIVLGKILYQKSQKKTIVTVFILIEKPEPDDTKKLKMTRLDLWDERKKNKSEGVIKKKVRKIKKKRKKLLQSNRFSYKNKKPLRFKEKKNKNFHVFKLSVTKKNENSLTHPSATASCAKKTLFTKQKNLFLNKKNIKNIKGRKKKQENPLLKKEPYFFLLQKWKNRLQFQFMGNDSQFLLPKRQARQARSFPKRLMKGKGEASVFLKNQDSWQSSMYKCAYSTFLRKKRFSSCQQENFVNDPNQNKAALLAEKKVDFYKTTQKIQYFLTQHKNSMTLKRQQRRELLKRKSERQKKQKLISSFDHSTKKPPQNHNEKKMKTRKSFQNSGKNKNQNKKSDEKKTWKSFQNPGKNKNQNKKSYKPFNPSLQNKVNLLKSSPQNLNEKKPNHRSFKPKNSNKNLNLPSVGRSSKTWKPFKGKILKKKPFQRQKRLSSYFIKWASEIKKEKRILSNVVPFMEQSLSNLFNENVYINFVTSRRVHTSAIYLAEAIVRILKVRRKKKRIPHNLILKCLRPTKFCKNIMGVRVECSGRISGIRIAKKVVWNEGRTSRNIFSQRIDFATKTVITKYGTIGVKVWIAFSTPLKPSV